jgi:hypothetical protein
MHFPAKAARTSIRMFPGLWITLLLASLWAGCNLASDEAHTYFTIKKDTAWSKFDRLVISWRDSASGAGATLFDGPPSSLAPLTRFQADGYKGGPIAFYFRGYAANILAFEEKRGYDAAHPKVVTKEFTPINPPAARKHVPALSPILGGKTISIGDSLTFTSEASIDSGSLAAFAWDCEGDGVYDFSGALSGLAAKLASGCRYPDAGQYTLSLKVRSLAESSASVSLPITVVLDAPKSDAGKDQTVYPGTRVSLHGIASDSLGSVARTEWKIGSGPFRPGGLDTSFTAPESLQDVAAVFRVTDDDSLSVIDSVLIHVVATGEPILSGITLSAGPLDKPFNPADTAYAASLPNSAATTTVTATLAAGSAGTILINGGTVASGTPSGDIDLIVGENLVTVTLQSASAAKKTYRIKLVRAPSDKVLLSGLTLSGGDLTPRFDPAQTEYSLSVSGDSISTGVTATLAATGSSLTINGQAANSGVPYRANLAVGPNTIQIGVASGTGEKKVYSVVVTRGPENNANLAALYAGGFNFNPAFSPSTLLYTLSVENRYSTVTLTATVQSANATVTVNDFEVRSGIPVQVNLTVGSNPIRIAVKAQSGTLKTYTLNVNRGKSGEARLKTLIIPKGILDPAGFSPDSTAYRLSVGSLVSTLIVTPTLMDTTARLEVDGKATENGAASAAISIPAGSSSFSIVVTAQDGSKKTYTISVKRNAKVVAIACGAGATVALRADGSVYQWGTFAFTSKTVPMPPNLTGVKAIAAGPFHALAVKTDGTVVAWGSDEKSQSQVPAGLTGVVMVAAGSSHSVALKADGTVVAWGDNSAQQLYVPAGLSGVKSITAGGTYTLALQNDSTMVGWASDVFGETHPPASGFKNVVALQAAAEGYFNLAVKADGSVLAWGSDLNNELKLPTGLGGVIATASYGSAALALKKDKTVVGWGAENGGRLTIPAGLTGVSAISLGAEHGVALKEDGTVVGWGGNAFGEAAVPADVN